MHVGARVRPARLPRADPEVHAEDRALDGGVEVRVGEDDHRVLAAELEGDVLDAHAGGGLLDLQAGGDRAGEADAADLRMPDDRVAGLRAAADHVEHARWEALTGQLAEDERRERDLRRRLDDDRVAGDERAEDARGGEHHRVVVGEDLADDPVGLVGRVVQVAGGGRDRATAVPADEPGPVTDVLQRDGDVDVHRAVREAAVDRVEHREALGVLLDQRREAREDLGPAVDAERRPGGLRVVRGLKARWTSRSRRWEPMSAPRRSRVARLHRRPVRGIDEVTPDQHPEVVAGDVVGDRIRSGAAHATKCIRPTLWPG